jgi:small GTP-binding protein
MIGDSGVGKTTIVKWVSAGIFLSEHTPTIGGQFVTLEIIVEGTTVTLELWDTAGQEVYRALVGFYARDSQGAILVVDSTATPDLDSARDWLRFIRDESTSAKVLLFVNKIDRQADRILPTEICEKFAAANGLEVIEGSAKTGLHVREAFESLAAAMAAGLAPAPAIGIPVASPSGQSGGSCC